MSTFGGAAGVVYVQKVPAEISPTASSGRQRRGVRSRRAVVLVGVGSGFVVRRLDFIGESPGSMTVGDRPWTVCFGDAETVR